MKKFGLVLGCLFFCVAIGQETLAMQEGEKGEEKEKQGEADKNTESKVGPTFINRNSTWYYEEEGLEIKVEKERLIRRLNEVTSNAGVLTKEGLESILSSEGLNLEELKSSLGGQSDIQSKGSEDKNKQQMGFCKRKYYEARYKLFELWCSLEDFGSNVCHKISEKKVVILTGGTLVIITVFGICLWYFYPDVNLLIQNIDLSSYTEGARIYVSGISFAGMWNTTTTFVAGIWDKINPADLTDVATSGAPNIVAEAFEEISDLAGEQLCVSE